eukprot:GHRR01009887.1.p1 GENE.GHRR01009887.1~~GHRR01009887.1.p1  ORF type:complete len:846 (+),score=292.20 GHRR01009887.1:222-2759(+)
MGDQTAASSLQAVEQPWPRASFAGPPECRPISTVTQLLTWQPPQHTAQSAAPAGPTDSSAAVIGSHSQQQPQQSTYSPVVLTNLRDSSASGSAVADPCSSSIPLVLSRPRRGQAHGSRPQLLVCHDMMGGYLPQDTLLAGSANPNHYRLWHWDCIDVFVYFSHHLVTIPPKGWVHTAHKHGTQMLGTFITEFGQGRHICNRLFSSKASAEAVADQLVAIAAHYGFEGWLVNIENSLSLEQVAVMQHFVGYLRARVHAEIQHGLVVWYDAVTTQGELRWQNTLSPLNAPFYDLADALFVNYTWTPQILPATAAAAANRMSQVYLGVDVHGRGSYGGGGHNVDVALQAARSAGLSAALFAPGWIYENLDRTRFHEFQEQWWYKVQAAWGYSHAVMHALPFRTTFNAGAGLAWFSNGRITDTGKVAAAAAAAAAGVPSGQDGCEVAGAGATADADGESDAEGQGASGWFNMLLTDVLPSCREPIAQQVIPGPVVGRLTATTAYQGGSCFLLCSQPSQHDSTQSTEQQQQQHYYRHSHNVTQLSNLTAAEQQQQRDSTGDQQGSDAATAVAAPSISAPLAGTQELLLLQLLTAAVPVQHDMLLELSCVFAASAPALAAADTTSITKGVLGNNVQAQSSKGSCSKQQSQSTPSRPRLWVMTERVASVAATKNAFTATRGTKVAGGGSSNNRKTIFVPIDYAAGDKSASQLPIHQELQLPDGEPSGVEIVMSEFLGPSSLDTLCQVTCVQQPTAIQHSKWTDGSSKGHNDGSSSGIGSMWDVDLTHQLKGCYWQRSKQHLVVPPGNVIVGIGVAVPRMQPDNLQDRQGLRIEAVIGQIDVSYTFASLAHPA